MALTSGSKILVSDINTALSNKQDKLSYTPVKSVNGTTADTAGDVSLVVTQVGSFTGTSGKSGSPVTKTITGLTKYKPLYIMVRQNSSKTSGVYCHITSGISVVDAKSSNLMATQYSSIWMAVIPISTSVVLNFSSSSSSEGVAYQAFAWQ